MSRWLNSLATRAMAVLLVGIGLAHVASMWTYQFALNREAVLASEARLADRLLSIKHAVMRVEPAEREDVAHSLSGGPIEAHWSRTEHAVTGGPGAAAFEGLGRRLLELAPELADDGLIIGANRQAADDPHLALISMRLPDASWVNVSLVAWKPRAHGGHGALLSTTLMAFGAVLVSLLLVRWLVRPLSTFASAARQLYARAETIAVPETGPTEVKDLAAAFNEMQHRIKQLVDTRTQALAAVSHDLKTPITRLRLRMEDFADREERAAIHADLDEMERMIDQTLSYLRGDRSDEEPRPIDVAAILETIAGDLADRGHDVSVEGSGLAVVIGRHLALRRALGNVAENAVKYGGRAIIRVADKADAVTVTVADDGPGVPEHAHEMVFEPFVRLEPSRNLETGGFGLGLTIARTIVERHGGSIRLTNRAPRGLEVRIVLPKGGAAA